MPTDRTRAAALIGTLCGAMLCLSSTQAQQPTQRLDEDVQADDARKEQAAVAAGAQVAIPVQRLKRDPFDKWVFLGGDEITYRRVYALDLKTRIAEIDLQCFLKGEQRERLEVAGRYQIERLFESVEECRERWSSLLAQGKRDREMMWDLQAAKKALALTDFGEGTFFDKVARHTMTPGQLPAYRQFLTTHPRSRRTKSEKEKFVKVLEAEAQLSTEQQVQFADVLDEVTNVRKGPAAYNALVMAAEQIPAERYQAFLNERQWVILKSKFDYVRIEEPYFVEYRLLEPADDPKN